MRNLLLGCVFAFGCVALGCDSNKTPNYTAPTPQDSGADKNKKALFPIPEDLEKKEQEPKKKSPE